MLERPADQRPQDIPADAPTPDRPKTFFGGIEGKGGSIEVPHVGIHVGTINFWYVARRGDDGRDADLFDLHASLSFVNRAIFDDPDFEKVVLVHRRNGRVYRVEQRLDLEPEITNTSLKMKGIKLCEP
jgi:hypothetical protein